MYADVTTVIATGNSYCNDDQLLLSNAGDERKLDPQVCGAFWIQLGSILQAIDTSLKNMTTVVIMHYE